ncbi:MAG: GMC family oxidoreductase N-terminal domain-containing protein [Gammaproteobacteria bacterium]|nr:GMC family oxidoreductase N-terminal domain-containing protein [Gammaproteobacteria bacterium]
MDTFDFIVVGAGSAGCVLANRLSANPSTRVLLLEAGGETHPLSRVPISFSLFIDAPKVNWRYVAEPEEATGDRAIPVPRGRMLGGSSAINGLVYVRGQPLDYNTWAQLGNRGWSYEDLLPVFRKMERYEGSPSELRATDGPLGVSVSPDESPIYEALYRAGEELGLPRNSDYNGHDQEGMCKTQTTISNGRRMSVSHCYLSPARRRSNLTVVTNAYAQKLLLDGKQCTGIEYKRGGKTVQVRANKDVVLSAGSINSPQLLELSGIGRPEVLSSHGIEVRHALAGVGENFRDHYAPRLAMKINGKGVTYNDRAKGLGLGWQILRYAITRKGFLSIPSAPMLAFLKSRDGLETPDIQVHFVPFTVKNVKKRQLGDDPGLTMTFYQLRPESLGSIHIKSSDPNAAPAIRFNFLSDPADQQCMLDGVRKMRELMSTQAMAQFRAGWIKPTDDIQSDDDVLDWVKATAETAYHPIGTCKMGNDPLAVVDAELRVHGIGGLRVADGSVMPTMVSGNTNAACIMIGEKAAEMILAS